MSGNGRCIPSTVDLQRQVLRLLSNHWRICFFFFFEKDNLSYAFTASWSGEFPNILNETNRLCRMDPSKFHGDVKHVYICHLREHVWHKCDTELNMV